MIIDMNLFRCTCVSYHSFQSLFRPAGQRALDTFYRVSGGKFEGNASSLEASLGCELNTCSRHIWAKRGIIFRFSYDNQHFHN